MAPTKALDLSKVTYGIRKDHSKVDVGVCGTGCWQLVYCSAQWFSYPDLVRLEIYLDDSEVEDGDGPDEDKSETALDLSKVTYGIRKDHSKVDVGVCGTGCWQLVYCHLHRGEQKVLNVPCSHSYDQTISRIGGHNR
jgi:hypothetical protein